MRMYDLIHKKREGGSLTDEAIRFIVNGYVKNDIPDYQISAWLMAIFFQGMSNEETWLLTDALARSGDLIDLSGIDGIKVDKHSTGGVGDKTSLIVGPIVAACGVRMAKMSGRGLGHTGGTIDKLESIPGLRTDITEEAFIQQVNDIGLAIIGQTAELAPGDKKLYALRDVTATVDSVPLIASSIMSKKLSAGSDVIELDVKTGSGAFMKTVAEAITLAEVMVSIGEQAGRRTAALVTDMDRPLGQTIGNAIEVAEAIRTLRGEGPEDLLELCLTLSAGLLELAGMGTHEACLAQAQAVIDSGAALDRFASMIRAQGGDDAVTRDLSLLPQASIIHPVTVPQSGWISRMDTEACGIASSLLGAGRMTMDDQINPAAGIHLHKRTGDRVKQGEPLADLYCDDGSLLEAATEELLSAYSFAETEPETKPLIFARVTREGVTRLY